MYFYDSYAIIEYVQGNSFYEKYFKDDPLGITTKLNLIEVYYSFIDDLEVADDVFDTFRTVCVDFSDDELKESVYFRKRTRLEKKGSSISYVDALGYVIAKKRGLKFLTGDQEFEDFNNVEYVK